MQQQPIRFTITVLFLLSLCFFFGVLGAFAPESNHVIGCLLIFATLLMMSPSLPGLVSIRSSGPKIFRPAFVAIVAALIMLVIAKSSPVWLAAACLYAFGLSAWFDDDRSTQWTGLGLTAVLYFILLTFFHPLELFWSLSLRGSMAATRTLGDLVDHTVINGPSASGWWICLLFACYFLAMFIVETRPWRFILGIASVLVAFAAFNIMNLHYPLLRYHNHTGLNLFNSQIACFVLCAASLYFFHRNPTSPQILEKRPRLWFIVFAQALIILSIVAHHLAAHGFGQSEGGGRIVIFGADPSASYDVPSFDRPGVGNSGMYGLLPKYLEVAGFQAAIVEQTEKLAELLDQAKTLVVICPAELFPPPLQERIWKFVEAGGSLLVMGDHTDIFHSMRPLNSLLAPVHIGFNFDSAYPARKAWRYSYEVFSHPATHALDQVNDILQYGTGASLSVSTPAYPVIVGKYGFSDKGDYSNEGQGAFLGDYAYQRDEQLGDVVLVAGAKYGQGKVLVFGDTSSFQNISLPYSYPFIVDIFTWLSHKEKLDYSALTYSSFVFVALAALVLIAGRQFNQPVAMTITALTITGGLFVSSIISPPGKAPARAPDRSKHLAYVDASHIGHFRLEHWENESIDGLVANLSRNGYTPVIMREFSKNWLEASEVYVSVSPTQPHSEGEMRALEDFVMAGGTALLAVGYEESVGSRDLLAHFGFRIGSVPLGAAPITDYIPTPEAFQKIMQEPHFMEAWPVEVTDGADHHVLYAYKDFPIVVARQRERGRVVVIGDTRFLHDKTLENERAAWPGNVEFLKKILLRREG